jgi:hypothetical protein
MDRLWPYAVASESELTRLGRAPVQTLEALEAVIQKQLVEHEEARLGVMMQVRGGRDEYEIYPFCVYCCMYPLLARIGQPRRSTPWASAAAA